MFGHAHAKCLFKKIFGHNYLISEPNFKLFVALFRTHEWQNDDMVIFFLWCFRKVRFRKIQFLKDGVQTVGKKEFLCIVNHEMPWYFLSWVLGSDIITSSCPFSL